MPVFNLDDLIAPTAEIRVGGITIPLKTLTVEQRGRVQARLRDIVPNPLEVARKSLAGMPNASREAVDAIWKTAESTYRFWPPLVESEEGQHWLMADEGLQRLIIGLATGHAPDSEEMRNLFARLEFVTLMRLIGFALTGTDTSAIDPKGPQQAYPAST